MHADAMPDADEATLADPAPWPSRSLELIRDAESLRSGSRVEAATVRASRDPVRAATAVRGEPASDRLLVVDAQRRSHDHRVDDLPALLRARRPARRERRGHAAGIAARPHGTAARSSCACSACPAGDAWPALLFGAGDWRTQTEDRPRPPSLAVGDELSLRGRAARPPSRACGPSRRDSWTSASTAPARRSWPRSTLTAGPCSTRTCPSRWPCARSRRRSRRVRGRPRCRRRAASSRRARLATLRAARVSPSRA